MSASRSVRPRGKRRRHGRVPFLRSQARRQGKHRGHDAEIPVLLRAPAQGIHRPDGKLPFDAHWFIALTAPRPWISIEGTDDQNCVPNAVRQSVLAARPVYAFLGVSAGRVGMNFEPHRHALTPDDWTAALDFADQQLRGIDHHRRFDLFPSESFPSTPAPPPQSEFGGRNLRP